MSTVVEKPPAKAQPLTMEQATRILAGYQELWNRSAMTEYLEGFTEDVVVEFADLPAVNGRKDLEKMITARVARQKGYQLKKSLRCVFDRTIVCSWTATWTDSKTERLMSGKGIEFIELREDGKCSRWEASFDAWDREGPRQSRFI